VSTDENHQIAPDRKRSPGSAGCTQLTFSCYGARIGVCCERQEVLDRLTPYLPPASRVEVIEMPDVWFKVEHVNGGQLRMSEEGSTEGFELEQSAALRHLQSMFHDSVAQNARDFLFVHAGVVALKDQAIIFPGRTMSGKTTTVATLVKAGAKYLSDEFAVLTKDGLVCPYVKPLSIRGPDGLTVLTPVEEIGGEAVSAPIPAKAVVHTNYVPGATWQPEHLTPGQTLMALLDNTVAVRKVPEFTMDFLGRVVRGTVGYTGPRGEASQFVRRLLEELDNF
jgi:hypothetical protein